MQARNPSRELIVLDFPLFCQRHFFAASCSTSPVKMGYIALENAPLPSTN
jgi:hypothetical protein